MENYIRYVNYSTIFFLVGIFSDQINDLLQNIGVIRSKHKGKTAHNRPVYASPPYGGSGYSRNVICHLP
jgi:hypothetical protein